MTEQNRIEMNKMNNKPFITAFKYFAGILTERSQKRLCELMGIPSSRISEYNTGKKPVSEEAINALIRVSAKHGRQIYSEYLHGNSDIMLLENVTDEEMADAEMRKNNPDYELIKSRKKRGEENHTDQSSLINAALAAKDDAIESLKRELQTKDETIQALRDQLATKDQLIAEQKARLIDYRRIIDAQGVLSDFHFPVGVADKRDSEPTRV